MLIIFYHIKKKSVYFIKDMDEVRAINEIEVNFREKRK